MLETIQLLAERLALNLLEIILPANYLHENHLCVWTGFGIK